MAVSPDLLLNLKAPTAAAKAATAAPKTAPQASRDEPSSFANVYARERQVKPAERQDTAVKPVRDKPAGEKPSQETAKAGGTETPAAAVAGKPLPDEPATADRDAEGAEAELDPLLLFGMGGQAVPSDEQAPVQALTGSECLAGLALTEAVNTGESEGEPALAAQRSLALQPAAQKTPLPSELAPDGAADDTGEWLPASLLASEVPTEESDATALDESFGDLLDKLDGPKESRASATDAALNRLNPLTQAIAQQSQAAQVQRPVSVPGQPVQMQHSGWSEAVVDRVMWLSSQNLKSAEIQLDPAELGRMEVRIDMNKDLTQVTFMSPHAGVRDALEGQMQRLREMFAQQGMTMDVNVSDQSRGWQGEGGDPHARRVAGDTPDDEDVSRGTLEIGRGGVVGDRGLVDYYA